MKKLVKHLIRTAVLLLIAFLWWITFIKVDAMQHDLFLSFAVTLGFVIIIAAVDHIMKKCL